MTPVEAKASGWTAPVSGAGGRRFTLGGRLALWCGGLGALLFLTAVLAASHGPAQVPYEASATVMLQPFGISLGEVTPIQRRIIEQIRLPRIVVGVLVGAALAVSGAALQAVFRNPLADPGIVGVTGGAALGAVSAIAIGWGSIGERSPFAQTFGVPTAAFVGALVCTAAVTFLASAGGRLAPATLVLSGLAIQSFAGAGTSAVITLSGDSDLVRNMLFWLVGGLDSRSWAHVRLALGPIFLGILVLLSFSRDLNVLAQGEETAHGLGVNVRKTRLIVLIVAALVTATATSVSGTIAFIGLVVPHACRLLVGRDHRILLPVSALSGAVFLVFADTAARLAVQPVELRVGIVTALAGAPFFVFLLTRYRLRIGVW